MSATKTPRTAARRTAGARTNGAAPSTTPTVPEEAGHVGTTDAEALDTPVLPLDLEPFPFPLRVRRSGVYRADTVLRIPDIPIVEPLDPRDIPIRIPPVIPPLPPIDPGGAGAAEVVTETTAAQPLFLTREELRVDIDGLFPTRTVSGTITRLFGGSLNWIARVAQDASGAWVGAVVHRDGTTDLRPHTRVSVVLGGHVLLPAGRTATVTFSGGPASTLIKTYTYDTQYFRTVTFEYDTVAGATAVTSYTPSSHPTHPTGVPTTPLTIEGAFARVGIRAIKTGGDTVVPLAGAGANATWSDLEMHDAMQAHWSRWQNAAQWSVWVLFARLHDDGQGLGGIMFDDIGAAQRQGCAIFSDSFIARAPGGEAHPGPWVQRMRFWTAVHEIGHTFNLAHSWQKSLGTGWIPLTNEPAALSYMNYPYNHPAGLNGFFGGFEYTFSPDELLFLRHAPARFVQQGNATWFDHHGFSAADFEQLREAATGPLALELRVHRRDGVHEYLEPVVAELVLRNTSPVARAVDEDLLNAVSVVVQKEDGPARRWEPFARRCQEPSPRVLAPGEAIYRSVFLSAGPAGWLISDPGRYTAYAVADLGEGALALSAPLQLRVSRPRSSAAADLADDVFTREVAHTLAFGGSRELDEANATLAEVVQRLPGTKVAMHAAAVLGAPQARDGKVLRSAPGATGELIEVVPADPEAATDLLSTALSDFGAAADSLGHIGVAEQTRTLAAVLDADGNTKARNALLRTAADTLAERGVLPGVVAELRTGTRS